MYQGSLWAFLMHLHPRTIPEAVGKVRFTWCMGGLALWMFVIESITGVLLALHYIPALNGAYPSIQMITHVVPYGFFIRNLHYWCAQIMVVLVMLHMIRVFVTNVFSQPRHLNWMIGVLLLVGTLLVDFTGYVLVSDARSLWAWTIARNVAATVPVLGYSIADALFGPADWGDRAVIRVYAWHVVLLPAMITVLISWHVWRTRKDGGIGGPL